MHDLRGNKLVVWKPDVTYFDNEASVCVCAVILGGLLVSVPVCGSQATYLHTCQRTHTTHNLLACDIYLPQVILVLMND